MKKIKNRAFAAILLSLAVVFGLGIFIFQITTQGADWIAFSGNSAIYQDGVLTVGTIYDRNGVALASYDESGRVYSDDPVTREAVLHAVGDFSGNIGTGAVTVFADELVGYSIVTGLNSEQGELNLTIDSELSKVAYTALAGRNGAVFVYNYNTGEIITMVSSPSYDPLNLPNFNDPYYEGVFLNRSISSTYTPGSVFKIITLAAAIENIDDLYSRSFSCTGHTIVSGVQINCTAYHGAQTIEQAFANSCNSAFSEISLELGGDILEEYASNYGLLEQLEFNGILTAAGRFDKDVDGSPGLAWSGIGQFNDLVSPIAMARVAGAVAGGGSTEDPHVLVGETSGSSTLMSADTAQKVRDIMSYTVINSYGTWNFPDLAIAGKTGTAEVGEDEIPHSWFVGFLEDTTTPYAFAVIVENGGSGLSAAGSVANQVLQAAVN